MTQRRTVITGLTGLAASYLLGGCSRAPAGPPAPRRVKLGPLRQFHQAETVLFVERVLVRRDHRGLSAMSMVCTHQSCMIRADQEPSNGFICPCHGSRFNLSGQVQGGPANRDLPWLELEIDGEKTIWAIFGKEVSPEWRLSDGPLSGDPLSGDPLSGGESA